MSHLHSIIFICGLHLAVAISPGPNIIAICCTASITSRRAGLFVAAGVVTATALWLSLALLGTEAVLARHQHLLHLFQIFSGFYLIFVGLRMLVTPPVAKAARACGHPFLLGLLTALSNPVAMAFWLGAFLASIPSDMPDQFNMILFALIIMQSSILYFTLAALASSALPGRVFGAARSLRPIGATTMILIGTNALIAA